MKLHEMLTMLLVEGKVSLNYMKKHCSFPLTALQGSNELRLAGTPW